MRKIYTALFCAFCITNAYADACPTAYPNNVPGTSICYLITGPGEYVPAPGAGVAPCPADDYCPGGDKIYYEINIPDRYNLVEYLENNSTAYIDTGHIPTSTTTVNADVLITGGKNDNPNYPWMPFIGTQVDFSQRYSVGVYPAAGKHQDATGKVDFEYFISSIDCKSYENNYMNQRFNFKTKIKENTIHALINDAEQCSIAITPTPNFPRGLSLFQEAGDNANRHAYGRFYFYQTYEADELVQNMIPVYDTASKQYGMYDTVSNTFFPSANDDKFTGGPIIDTTSFADLPTSGGNFSCAGATENEFISSPQKSTDVTDCGKILHLGNHKLYLRRRQITHPALAAQYGRHVLYAEMTTEKCGHLRTSLNGVVYSICNINSD